VAVTFVLDVTVQQSKTLIMPLVQIKSNTMQCLLVGRH